MRPSFRYRRRIRAIELGIEEVPSIVPLLKHSTGRRVPLNTNAELILFCRRVYDFRLKRLIKNPTWIGLKWVSASGRHQVELDASPFFSVRIQLVTLVCGVVWNTHTHTHAECTENKWKHTHTQNKKETQKIQNDQSSWWMILQKSEILVTRKRTTTTKHKVIVVEETTLLISFNIIHNVLFGKQ